jgi:L-threonylcarbamoyladenylate synthase
VRVLDLCAEPDVDLVPVVAHIRSGGLVAYPTETVYGIGGVCSIEASMRVRELKGREEAKPLIALVSNRESVGALEWTPEAVELAATFWPGSLTLVLRDPSGLFPDGVRDSGRRAVAVRVSPHRLVSHLIQKLGEPLTSTSLNRSGEPAITTGSAAREFLVKLETQDVWLIDGGSLPPSLPSTIVDCTTAPPSVLREGAIPLERLRSIIEEVDGSGE